MRRRGIARYWGWMIPDGKKCKTGQNGRRARWRCIGIQTTRQLNFPDPNKVVRINAKHIYKIISFNPSAMKRVTNE